MRCGDQRESKDQTRASRQCETLVDEEQWQRAEMVYIDSNTGIFSCHYEMTAKYGVTKNHGQARATIHPAPRTLCITQQRQAEDRHNWITDQQVVGLALNWLEAEIFRDLKSYVLLYNITFHFYKHALILDPQRPRIADGVSNVFSYSDASFLKSKQTQPPYCDQFSAYIKTQPAIPRSRPISHY